MTDLVSIIIPTYNRFESFLKNSIESAMTQTYKNLEIIITDDCSTKNKQEQDIYILNLRLMDRRIKYISSNINVGFVENLNKALSIATGKYISILFDDDKFLPNYIENAVRILNKDQDLAFVQQGSYNNLGPEKTLYITKYCGKMTLYTYLYYLHPYYNNGIILWSVSPCNYVFRNRSILLRTILYDDFDQRQLKRGSGYDILYILDNFENFNYCYHLPNHTVIFNSHKDSVSVSHSKEVIDDTKKGIFQYFAENPFYYKIELNKYLVNEVFFNSNDLIDKINYFIDIIETYKISIYEIKSIFYSNDIYTLSFDKLKKLISHKNVVNPDIYNEIYNKLIKENRRIPLLSEVKHCMYNETQNYNDFVLELLNVNKTDELSNIIKTTTRDNLECKIINSNTYNSKFKTTSRNIILNYYNDLIKRKFRKIAIVVHSNNIKYGMFFDDSIFERKYVEYNKNNNTWNNLFIRYLNRSYSKSEFNMHHTKDLIKFEKELYECNEFAKINQLNKNNRIIFDDFKKMKDDLWNYIPIIFKYVDVINIYKLPKNEWDSYIKKINFNDEYYYNTKYNYTLNEIIGNDIFCGIQLSGHLRYYDSVYESFKYLNNITNVNYFMFIWTESLGFKYVNNTTNQIINDTDDTINVTIKINDCVKKFNPKKIETNNNKTFLMENLFHSGIKFIDYNGCAYPQLKSQYYSIYRTNELKKYYESENDFEHDIVFKLRFDAILDYSNMDITWLFNFYFMVNFNDVIYVSNEKDHSHEGNVTSCKICNKTYYISRLIQKHNGDHYNDICDFLAITSSKTMNYYASIYNDFEDIYVNTNDDLWERILLGINNNKLIKMGKSNTISNTINSMYDHYQHKNINEYNTHAKLPLYPEAFLRTFLKNYIVVSNNYFRIMHKY